MVMKLSLPVTWTDIVKGCCSNQTTITLTEVWWPINLCKIGHMSTFSLISQGAMHGSWWEKAGVFTVSRRFCPKWLTVNYTYIHTLMAVAAMQGADQHIRRSWGSVSCPRTLQHADQGNRPSDWTELKGAVGFNRPIIRCCNAVKWAACSEKPLQNRV